MQWSCSAPGEPGDLIIYVAPGCHNNVVSRVYACAHVYKAAALFARRSPRAGDGLSQMCAHKETEFTDLDRINVYTWKIKVQLQVQNYLNMLDKISLECNLFFFGRRERPILFQVFFLLAQRSVFKSTVDRLSGRWK